jgi:hypothetical protein
MGFDPKAPDPLSKLQIGKIICLADPDPDGPLVGGTRVMLCDGTRPTIKQLAARFAKDPSPFWVWSTGKSGKLVPAQATLPMEVSTKTKLVEITTDDGSTFRCSLNHKWPVNASSKEPSEFRNEVPYLRADELAVGDSLRSISFDTTPISGGEVGSVYNHTVTKIRHLDVDPTPVYCLSVPGHQNFLVEDSHGNGVATGNSHINCLLLTLFKTYLPGMFERGMIYVADTPEFYSIHKDQIFVGEKISEVKAKLKTANVKSDIFHVKGWGEVDAQVVKKWVIDDDTRKLIKLGPLTAEDKSVFGRLMGSAEPEPKSSPENTNE